MYFTLNHFARLAKLFALKGNRRGIVGWYNAEPDSSTTGQEHMDLSFDSYVGCDAIELVDVDDTPVLTTFNNTSGRRFNIELDMTGHATMAVFDSLIMLAQCTSAGRVTLYVIDPKSFLYSLLLNMMEDVGVTGESMVAMNRQLLVGIGRDQNTTFLPIEPEFDLRDSYPCDTYDVVTGYLSEKSLAEFIGPFLITNPIYTAAGNLNYRVIDRSISVIEWAECGRQRMADFFGSERAHRETMSIWSESRARTRSFDAVFPESYGSAGYVDRTSLPQGFNQAGMVVGVDPASPDGSFTVSGSAAVGLGGGTSAGAVTRSPTAASRRSLYEQALEIFGSTAEVERQRMTREQEELQRREDRRREAAELRDRIPVVEYPSPSANQSNDGHVPDENENLDHVFWDTVPPSVRTEPDQWHLPPFNPLNAVRGEGNSVPSDGIVFGTGPQSAPTAVTVPLATDPYAGILDTLRSDQSRQSGIDLNCKRSMMLEYDSPAPNEDL